MPQPVQMQKYPFIAQPDFESQRNTKLIEHAMLRKDLHFTFHCFYNTGFFKQTLAATTKRANFNFCAQQLRPFADFIFAVSKRGTHSRMPIANTLQPLAPASILKLLFEQEAKHLEFFQQLTADIKSLRIVRQASAGNFSGGQLFKRFGVFLGVCMDKTKTLH